MKKPATKHYALRIDGPLVKPLQELKKQNRRSLNAEINAALEAWVAAPHNGTSEVASSSKSAEASQTEAAPRQSRTRKPTSRKAAGAEAKAEVEVEATPEPAAASESATPVS
jgi:hypothetical protein